MAHGYFERHAISRWKGASIQIFHYTHALRAFPWGLNINLNWQVEGSLQVQPGFRTAVPQVYHLYLGTYPNKTMKSVYLLCSEALT